MVAASCCKGIMAGRYCFHSWTALDAAAPDYRREGLLSAHLICSACQHDSGAPVCTPPVNCVYTSCERVPNIPASLKQRHTDSLTGIHSVIECESLHMKQCTVSLSLSRVSWPLALPSEVVHETVHRSGLPVPSVTSWAMPQVTHHPLKCASTHR